MLFWSICNWDDNFQHTRTYLGLVCSFVLVWKCANKHFQDYLLLSLSWNVHRLLQNQKLQLCSCFWSPTAGGGRFCWAQLCLQQLWAPGRAARLLFKQDAALPLGTGSLLPFLSIRAHSLCCPILALLGCLGIRSHVLMIHQPWQWVQFWPWKELEMTEIRERLGWYRGTAIELWLFHCSPPCRIIRAFHLSSQGDGTLPWPLALLFFLKNSWWCFGGVPGACWGDMGCVCENALGVLQTSLSFLLPCSCSLVFDNKFWQRLHTFPSVWALPCCALCMCPGWTQVPAVLWGSLPDPAQAWEPLYYPLCTDADCRPARANLCQGHPVSQGKVRSTAQQDSAFFQDVNFCFQE